MECAIADRQLSDNRQRRIGNANRDSVRRALTSLATVPLTMKLDMSIEEVTDLVLRASMDAANADLKPYFPM